jgi:hypothetical protein
VTLVDTQLWDEYGVPKQQHVPCPQCGDAYETNEVGSSFDHAWCHRCGWQGSLTTMRSRCPIPSQEAR